MMFSLLVLTYSIAGAAEIPGYEKLLDEQRIIKELVENPESNYDWRVRPRGSLQPPPDEEDPTGPVLVTVNMYLRSISKVDDVNMEYSLHFTFREEWVDERLFFVSDRLSHIVLSPGQKIWMPDTFFQNEKEGKKHDIDTPNVLIRVFNGTGRILYSTRLTLTLSCPMRLSNYPLDVQECKIDFASYAYTTDDIEYTWKDESPIQIKQGLSLSLPSFLLSSVTTGNCTSVTNTGVYSCMSTILELKREFSYYLLQLYIPSFMLVAVSWVSFWLDKDSVPARVTLGVTTLLTMTTQASGVNANLPPVSYTKAIDIWIGVCLAFIFGALLEFALVNWAARKDLCQNRGRRSSNFFHRLTGADYELPGYSSVPPDSPIIFANPQHTSSAPRQPKVSWWHDTWHRKYRENSRRIDLISRALFPVFFIIFNLVYWWLYLRPYMSVKSRVQD
ncbi:unnamed protein product, partial [Mesorhabditis spiculigera]